MDCRSRSPQQAVRLLRLGMLLALLGSAAVAVATPSSVWKRGAEARELLARYRQAPKRVIVGFDPVRKEPVVAARREVARRIEADMLSPHDVALMPYGVTLLGTPQRPLNLYVTPGRQARRGIELVHESGAADPEVLSRSSMRRLTRRDVGADYAALEGTFWSSDRAARNALYSYRIDGEDGPRGEGTGYHDLGALRGYPDLPSHVEDLSSFVSRSSPAATDPARSVVYQVPLWTVPGGGLRGVEQLAPVLEELGVTHVMLTPWGPEDGDGVSSGRMNWGYNVSGLHKAIADHRGGPEAARRLMTAMNQRGIVVVTDLVLHAGAKNHVNRFVHGYDSPAFWIPWGGFPVGPRSEDYPMALKLFAEAAQVPLLLGAGGLRFDAHYATHYETSGDIVAAARRTARLIGLESQLIIAEAHDNNGFAATRHADSDRNVVTTYEGGRGCLLIVREGFMGGHLQDFKDGGWPFDAEYTHRGMPSRRGLPSAAFGRRAEGLIREALERGTVSPLAKVVRDLTQNGDPAEVRRLLDAVTHRDGTLRRVGVEIISRAAGEGDAAAVRLLDDPSVGRATFRSFEGLPAHAALITPATHDQASEHDGHPPALHRADLAVLALMDLGMPLLLHSTTLAERGDHGEARPRLHFVTDPTRSNGPGLAGNDIAYMTVVGRAMDTAHFVRTLGVKTIYDYAERDDFGNLRYYRDQAGRQTNKVLVSEENIAAYHNQTYKLGDQTFTLARPDNPSTWKESQFDLAALNDQHGNHARSFEHARDLIELRRDHPAFNNPDRLARQTVTFGVDAQGREEGPQGQVMVRWDAERSAHALLLRNPTDRPLEIRLTADQAQAEGASHRVEGGPKATEAPLYGGSWNLLYYSHDPRYLRNDESPMPLVANRGKGGDAVDLTSGKTPLEVPTGQQAEPLVITVPPQAVVAFEKSLP